jgi:thiol-disulfide isomerase/thioredoxin
MPSSRSSRLNNSSKSSNSSSSSKSMSKDNYYCLIFLALIAILFAIYYFTYKSNREPFSDNNNNNDNNSRRKNSGRSSSSGSPNLKASQGETVVALFYADWCPHCVAFKPDFMKARKDMNGSEHQGKKLRLELVDCVANKTIASENSVSGFPTVKIFTDDNKSSEYSGERSYEGLTSYLS